MEQPKYIPPYSFSENADSLVARICELAGRLSVQQTPAALRLRRVNRVRTIQGSLAIEGNTLTEEQISAAMEGQPVKEARKLPVLVFVLLVPLCG